MMPAFEPPVWQPTPETRVVTTKVVVDANWAQMLEGSIDSAHSSTLHSSDMVPARVPGAQSTVTQWQRPSTDKAPRLVIERTPYGFRYAAIRRPIKDAATHDYVRTTLFVAPYLVHIPPNNLHRSCTVHVPRDDTSTTFYFVAFGGDQVPAQEDWRKLHANRVGFDLDATYRNTRTLANDYRQDRQAMKLGNFTGIPGITNQDIVMWESMGGIVDRTLDRLGASDIAVVEFRKQMVEAAKHRCRRRCLRSAPPARASRTPSSSRSKASWPRRPTGATSALRRRRSPSTGRNAAARGPRRRSNVRQRQTGQMPTMPSPAASCWLAPPAAPRPQSTALSFGSIFTACR